MLRIISVKMLIKTLQLVFLFFVAANCNCYESKTHGYRIENYKNISIGEHKMQVLDKLGLPVFKSYVHKNTWYYTRQVLTRTRIGSFSDISESKVLEVKFDDSDKVKSMFIIGQNAKLNTIKYEAERDIIRSSLLDDIERSMRGLRVSPVG